MSDEKKITNKIQEIKNKIDKKSRATGEQSTLAMLFDIEAQLEEYFTFFKICKEADQKSVQDIVTGIKKKAREAKHKAQNEKSQKEQEAAN